MNRLLQAETETYNSKVDAFHAPWTSAERQVELFIELSDRDVALDRKEADLSRILAAIRDLESEMENTPVEEMTALIIGLNIRHKCPEGLGIRFTGLPNGS